MTTFQDLSDATFVSIESYRKNGTGIKSPVWMTHEDGKLYCWTGADSWKVKRIRNNPEVKLAESDAQGTLKSEQVPALGKVLDAPQDVKTQVGRMAKKFGIQFRMFQLMGMFRRSKYVAIEFSPTA